MRIECDRCGKIPVSHRVQSDKIDMAVCAECAVVAYKTAAEQTPGCDGEIVVKPLEAEVLRELYKRA